MTDSKREDVRELGDRIGYGRLMQLAGDMWNEQQPGGAFALGPCRACLVPCPCPAWERDANGHCNVCCGSHQVTERVRDMLSEMLRLKRQSDVMSTYVETTERAANRANGELAVLREVAEAASGWAHAGSEAIADGEMPAIRDRPVEQAMSAGRCECPCLGCKHFCGQDAPVDGHQAHHARMLVALDRSIAAAARGRGIQACDGLDEDTPCDISTMHSVAAEVAIAFAAMVEDPTVDAHEHLEDKMLKFFIELEHRFTGHPKKERVPQ